MTGSLLDLGPIEPCADMHAAHDAADRGDDASAALHYAAAAQVAWQRADASRSPQWAVIGELRTLWSQRAWLRSVGR